jgi:hypothetical protein
MIGNKKGGQIGKMKIYKNDLKFSEKFDFQITEFESETVENLYNIHKNKPKIEMRLTDSKMENFEYLDLSCLDLNDDLLKKLFELEKIKIILSKIKYLDLSTNNLTKYPNLTHYKNIIYLSINKNYIEGIINDNNLIELTCDYNRITKITSSSITKLSANNNCLIEINVPNVKVLHINYNKIKTIGDYIYLEYLECIGNEIKTIHNLIRLQEIYIGNNNLESMINLPSLLVLNCINNPIKRINFFGNLNLLMCSTSIISKKYDIGNITKIKNDFLYNIKQQEPRKPEIYSPK